MIQCEICLQECKIPVKIICFPCSFNHSKINCYSMKRFCLKCVRSYFELHLEKNERMEYKRCLYCQSYVNPQILSSRQIYEKDFLIMSFDSSIYNCIHDKCDFKGTQLEINQHLKNCCYTILKCKECDEKYQYMNHIQHLQSCSWHIVCDICEEYVPYRLYDKHLNDQHEMQTCYYCDEIILNQNMLHHINDECEYRPIKCKYCIDYYEMMNEKEHLHKHLQNKNNYKSYLLSKYEKIENECHELENLLK